MHTPGPWEAVSPVVRTKRTEDGIGGFEIADCHHTHWPVPERQANCVLIAAAPELLAVVEKIARATANDEVSVGFVEMAKVALAKATGAA